MSDLLYFYHLIDVLAIDPWVTSFSTRNRSAWDCGIVVLYLKKETKLPILDSLERNILQSIAGIGPRTLKS